MTSDTIAAPATPPGEGGIGVIRISGPAAGAIAEAVAGPLPPPREAQFRTFRAADGEALDHGLVLSFPAPNSFTGETVVELHGHGGPVVVDRVLQQVLGLGARLAEPGEFSQRAFLNGRMDLTQAEAVADLIGSQSVAAARSAMRSLEGVFGETVEGLATAIFELRVRVEALLDFPDEEIEAELETCGTELARLTERVAEVRREAGRGRVLAEGLRTVIIGAPNAGKSSLMNALSRRESAIVTDIPGTTRDLLRERVVLGGVALELMDTAGVHATEDPIEQAGIARAEGALASADLVLHVVDDTEPRAAAVDALYSEHGDSVTAWLTLHNKIDRTGRHAGEVDGNPDRLAISAESGAGLDVLASRVGRLAGTTDGGGGFLARRRHTEALDQVAGSLERAGDQWRAGSALELVAEDLRRAHEALGAITGRVTSEDLLGGIFSSFCIGK